MDCGAVDAREHRPDDEFYMSFIIASRNDNYGGSLVERLNLLLLSLADGFARTDLSMEVPSQHRPLSRPQPTLRPCLRPLPP